jgi:uncharacterized protein YbbK (DUF523 family)
MIGASACLCGLECRYDAKANTVVEIEDLYKSGMVVDICPEQMGGLPTPRIPAEIQNGDGRDVWKGTAKVVSKTGADVTDQFKKGAMEALKRIQSLGVKKVILKERSPSCGSNLIYNGQFDGTKIPGFGVTSALFIENGIEVLSEEEYVRSCNREL